MVNFEKMANQLKNGSLTIDLSDMSAEFELMADGDIGCSPNNRRPFIVRVMTNATEALEEAYKHAFGVPFQTYSLAEAVENIAEAMTNASVLGYAESFKDEAKLFMMACKEAENYNTESVDIRYNARDVIFTIDGKKIRFHYEPNHPDFPHVSYQVKHHSYDAWLHPKTGSIDVRTEAPELAGNIIIGHRDIMCERVIEFYESNPELYMMETIRQIFKKEFTN